MKIDINVNVKLADETLSALKEMVFAKSLGSVINKIPEGTPVANVTPEGKEVPVEPVEEKSKKKKAAKKAAPKKEEPKPEVVEPEVVEEKLNADGLKKILFKLSRRLKDRGAKAKELLRNAGAKEGTIAELDPAMFQTVADQAMKLLEG